MMTVSRCSFFLGRMHITVLGCIFFWTYALKPN